ILNGRTHQIQSELLAGPPRRNSPPAVLGTIAFSPDSRVLAADVIRGPRRGAGIVRWDVRTGHRFGRVRQGARVPEPTLVGFTAGGGRLVPSSAADHATVIRDAASLRPVRRYRGGGTPYLRALSPDGRVVAFGAADGSVRLLDLHTGKVRVATDRHRAAGPRPTLTPHPRTPPTAGRPRRAHPRAPPPPP